MDKYSNFHYRKLWEDALLESGYSHSTKLKTMEYLKRASTITENGIRSEALLKIQKDCPTEEVFLERLEKLMKEGNKKVEEGATSPATTSENIIDNNLRNVNLQCSEELEASKDRLAIETELGIMWMDEDQAYEYLMAKEKGIEMSEETKERLISEAQVIAHKYLKQG